MATGVLHEGPPLATVGGIPCTSAAFAELSAEILRAGVGLRFRAHGASMTPLVRDGDVLLVRPADPNSVRIGDVVLCSMCSSKRGHVVVHRVVDKLAGPDGSRFTVQGDRVAWPDGTIPAAQVYGRVVTIERAGAHIDMDRPMMRLLGRLAVLRSRSALGRGTRFLLVRRLVRRLPVLARYLA